MAVEIQVRRDTAADWVSANPTLAQGEWGLETDTNNMKIGNGASVWTQLPYEIAVALVSASVAGTSGSVTFSQPFQTPSYKKTLAVISSGFTSSSGVAYTYPTPFAAIAAVTSNAVVGASVTAGLTSASVSVASALGVQALIAIEGY